MRCAGSAGGGGGEHQRQRHPPWAHQLPQKAAGAPWFAHRVGVAPPCGAGGRMLDVFLQFSLGQPIKSSTHGSNSEADFESAFLRASKARPENRLEYPRRRGGGIYDMPLLTMLTTKTIINLKKHYMQPGRRLQRKFISCHVASALRRRTRRIPQPSRRPACALPQPAYR